MIKKKIILILLIFPGWWLLAEDEYFRSNDIGMLLEQIDWYRKDDFEYVVERSRENGLEIRQLYRDGEETGSREIVYYPDGTAKSETEFRDGILQKVNNYDTKRRITEEIFYREGIVDKKSVYYYKSKDVLSYTMTYDGEGQLLYRDNYFLNSKGGLREIKRVWNDEKFQATSFILGRGRLVQETHSSESETIISRFDQDDRLVVRENWQDGQLAVRQSYSHQADTGAVSFLKVEEFVTGRIYMKNYNLDGNLIQEIIEQDGERIAVIDYTWDDRGNKTGEREKNDRGLLVRKFYYTADDNLDYEEEYVKGVLDTRIVYLGEETMYLEHYNHKGEAVIRIYYRDDVKFKEEIMDAGEVIFTREFE